MIHTSLGDMVVEFWPEVAPKTVANFKKLAAEGFYNGTCFHRIIKEFIIQGGDPLTKDPAQEARWGTGGPGYRVEAEFNNRSHTPGVIAMAHTGDPNSAGSQFFICLADVGQFLDHKYTAFGHLIKGQDVLAKIGDAPVTQGNDNEISKPTVRVTVNSIDLVDRSSIQ